MTLMENYYCERRRSSLEGALNLILALTCCWVASTSAKGQTTDWESRAMERGTAPFRLPELRFRLDALSPHLNESLITNHYAYHKQAVILLNRGIGVSPYIYPTIREKYLPGDWQSATEKWLADTLRALSFRTAEDRKLVLSYGAAHYNHGLFWQTIKSGGGNPPTESLLSAIERDFGGFDELKSCFVAASTRLQGEGWVWMVWKGGKLSVLVLPGEETPLSKGYEVLMGVDLWKHAYASQYGSDRSAYTRAVLSLVDWHWVGKRFSEISK